MTLNPVCENVETAQGVPLTVTGVAQVKIMKNADLLQTASEQFLGKKEHEIKSTVLQTLEGHLRAILGKNLFATETTFKVWKRWKIKIFEGAKAFLRFLSWHFRIPNPKQWHLFSVL